MGSRIAVPGMVDDFQKKYEALQIPYPKDNATAALDAQLVTKKAEYTKFVAESEAKVAERDPAQHRHSFAQLDTTTMKFHFNETYDQWEARMRVLQDERKVIADEAAERARKEREKMGLDY